MKIVIWWHDSCDSTELLFPLLCSLCPKRDGCNDVMLTLGVCVLVVLQMVDMVISMIVIFPKGASWNLRNVYGSPRHTRHWWWHLASSSWDLKSAGALRAHLCRILRSFGVSLVPYHVVFSRRVICSVTKFRKLIGGHSQQFSIFKLRYLIPMSNKNNLCSKSHRFQRAFQNNLGFVPSPFWFVLKIFFVPCRLAPYWFQLKLNWSYQNDDNLLCSYLSDSPEGNQIGWEFSLRFNEYLWPRPSCVVWGILFKAIKCCTDIEFSM